MLAFALASSLLSERGIAQVNTDACVGQNAFSPGSYDCDGTDWVLVFSDDFDGSSLDLSKWIPVIGVPRDFGTAPMWYKLENSIVSNGELKLRVKNEVEEHDYVVDWSTNPPISNTRTFNYTSAEIHSRFLFGEGRYEIKCKIPDGNGGFWPAFWMYGASGLMSNEIDVFEYWDNDWNKWRTNAWKNGDMCQFDKVTGLAGTSYLTYVLQWDRHNMLWWRDDEGTIRNYPRWLTLLGQPIGCNVPSGNKVLNTLYPSVPPIASSIIANLALRPQDILNTSIFPADMVVDYIRFYRRVPCLGNASFTTITSLVNTNGEYNFVTATNFSIGGAFTVGNGIQLEMVASSSVLLNPGFVAYGGSLFIGRIGHSNCGLPAGLAMSGSENIVRDDLFEQGENMRATTDSEAQESKRLKVIPNPAVDKITVECIQEGLLYCLIDIHGAILLQKEIGEFSSEFTWDVGGLDSGYYFLLVKDSMGNKIATHPVVIGQ